MGTILDRSYISCCTREDVDDTPQPPYIHQCGCPTVEVIAVSSEKDAELCGYSEFTDLVADPAIEASVPPKKYKRRRRVNDEYSFSNWFCCSGVPKKTVSLELDQSYEQIVEYSLNGDVCEGPNLISEQDLTVTGFEPASGTFICGPSANISGTINPNVPSDVVSKTRKETYIESISYFTSGDCDGEKSIELIINSFDQLSIEDTEEDALARATEVEGSTAGTLWEIRTDDFTFTKRSADYALKASGLQIDAVYKARAYLRRRPAIKKPSGSGYVDENGDPSEWSYVDDEDAALIDEYIFTATAEEMIVPTTGTWSDANEDEVIDDDEVTPAIEIPLEQGREYQIDSVNIELALTSETP